MTLALLKSIIQVINTILYKHVDTALLINIKLRAIILKVVIYNNKFYIIHVYVSFYRSALYTAVLFYYTLLHIFTRIDNIYINFKNAKLHHAS